MKARYRKVPTRFAPETRFEVAPVPAAPYRGTRETELDRLKERLLRELLNETKDRELYAPLRRAANEAAALAWATPFPLLLLPALLVEKAQTARNYVEHQKKVTRRCQPQMDEAA